MSSEHAALVWDAEGLTSSETLLLLAYTRHTDQHGYCWPGMARLVAMTKLSERTVKRVRKDLEAKNLLRQKRRTSKAGDSATNLYRINLVKLRSMRRKTATFDDDLIAELGFTDDVHPHPEPPSEPLSGTRSDLPIGHGDPTPGRGDPTPGRGDPTPGRGDPTPGVVVTPERSFEGFMNLSLDAGGRDGMTEGVTEEASPEEEPSAEALGVLGVVEWGEHRAPNKRETRELGRLLDAAAGEGRSWRLLRRHAVATVRQARPVREGGRAVSYLRNALSGDLLPVPDLTNNSASAATSVPVADTSTSGEDSEGQTVSWKDTSAKIHAFLAEQKSSRAGHKSPTAPETALNRP